MSSQFPTFVTFDWPDIDEFYAYGTQQGPYGTEEAQFVMDDLTVNTTPEPGALTLFSLGLLVCLSLSHLRKHFEHFGTGMITPKFLSPTH